MLLVTEDEPESLGLADILFVPLEIVDMKALAAKEGSPLAGQVPFDGRAAAPPRRNRGGGGRDPRRPDPLGAAGSLPPVLAAPGRREGGSMTQYPVVALLLKHGGLARRRRGRDAGPLRARRDAGGRALARAPCDGAGGAGRLRALEELRGARRHHRRHAASQVGGRGERRIPPRPRDVRPRARRDPRRRPAARRSCAPGCAPWRRAAPPTSPATSPR